MLTLRRGWVTSVVESVEGLSRLEVDGRPCVAYPRLTGPIELGDEVWDESFDIGSDTLTGVNDADYKPPFPLTAKLNKLTLKVDRPTLSEADIKKLENTEAIAVDGKPIHNVQPGPQ